MRLRGVIAFFMLGAVLFLHGGAIRKDRNVILETQTDPITLQKKMEELKDGEKGPPTPSFKFYEGEKFLGKSPVADENNTEAALEKDQLPMFGDPVPENLEGIEPSSKEDWWTEGLENPAEDSAKSQVSQWAEDW